MTRIAWAKTGNSTGYSDWNQPPPTFHEMPSMIALCGR